MKSEDYFILYRTSLAASRAFGVCLEKSSLFADIRSELGRLRFDTKTWRRIRDHGDQNRARQGADALFPFSYANSP